MRHVISLVPLDPALHGEALQGVYRETPGYWQMYGLPGCPPDQAAKDLKVVEDTPDRHMLGIVRRVDSANALTGGEMVGLIDFRLDWPHEGTAYVGMIMVAEFYQRSGIASGAWALLQPWLASGAGIQKVRLAVEQFNIKGLQFWQAQGFRLTGESNRMLVGDKFVRLLYLEAPCSP